MSTIYILRSERNKRYYIGCTKDLNRRLTEHNRGQTASTKHLIPLVCVFHQEVPDDQANSIERKLKRYKSRVVLDNIVKSGRLEI